MSNAAAQYHKFNEQAAREGRVFTFTSDGEYLIFPMSGNEVMPFWSSRTRMERVQRGHPKYQKYQIKEMPLMEFLEWLPKLGKDGIRVGTNWSGKRLAGYDIETKDLIVSLMDRVDRLKT